MSNIISAYLAYQLYASDVISSICLELHDIGLVEILKGLGLYEGVAEGKYSAVCGRKLRLIT
ncbi:MAG: hypothetical protein J7J99_06955 [Thermoprotei archaeon]|nr:hypothetical protein [Thermoprotei archaeon]